MRPDLMPVWGGTRSRQMPQPYRNQVRVVVLAPSGAAARRHLEAATGTPVTRTEWAHSWCDTGNALELVAARAAGEGVVLYKPETGGVAMARQAGLGGTMLPWWLDWPTQPEAVRDGLDSRT